MNEEIKKEGLLKYLLVNNKKISDFSNIELYEIYRETELHNLLYPVIVEEIEKRIQ